MPFLSVTSYFSIFFIPLFGIPIFNNSNKFKNEDFSEDQNLPNFPKQSKFQEKNESLNLTIISIEDISVYTEEIQKCKNSEEFDNNNVNFNLSLLKIKQVESFYIDGKINENETDITNK